MPRSARAGRLRRTALAAATTAAVASALIASPAFAAAPSATTTPPIDDPAAVLSAVAPEVLAETSASPLAPDAQSSGGFWLQLPTDAAQPIHLTPAHTEGAGRPVDITIQDAHGQPRTSAGITSYALDSAAAYIQPLTNGVRLMTAIAGPTAGEDFSYALDLPAGAHTTAVGDGLTVLSDATDHYIGTLAAAWARDASGTALATSYSWNGGTLTQHVDLTPHTAYPVVIDPQWFYDYDFYAGLPGYSAREPHASVNSVDHLLHGCFNCYFPIGGAPGAYPSDGDLINLNASPFSMITIPAPVRVQTAMAHSLQFIAQAGHFDGEGSTITFSWYNDTSGYIHLFVHALIKIDRGAAVNAGNKLVAGIEWLRYWQAVADNASATSGGGGV